MYTAHWGLNVSVPFIVNPVFGDKQCCQEDLHCWRDCESGFSRHSEAHGLCGILQCCLAGSYWDCSLSLLSLAGVLKYISTMQTNTNLYSLSEKPLTQFHPFISLASWPISSGRNCHCHPHFPTQRHNCKEKKQAAGKSCYRNPSHFHSAVALASGMLGQGCHSWFR